MFQPRIAWLLVGLLATLGRAQAVEQRLSDMDLVTLMNMDVELTSAARRAQVSSDAAAAVFVLTREDIRHSGASSIPELLRFVPGLQVARESNSRYAISARGFNSRFANKLLVLIDGRSIYTPEFSWVLWDESNVPLEEIERIEVVQGPGGSLWGANAVNGIINIITRSATEGTSLRVAAGLGDQDRDTASVHFGGGVTEGLAYRAYVEQFQRDSFDSSRPPWRHIQTGWRLDGSTDADSHYSVQGAINKNDFGELNTRRIAPAPLESASANLNLNWDSAAFADGRLTAQMSYAWRERERFFVTAEREQTVDLNLQYSAARRGRHLVTLGVGGRILNDDLRSNDQFVSFDPQHSTRDQESVFAQDEIFFFSDAVRMTLGAKAENDEYTGVSVQPTARALWHITGKHAVWTAYSRAVRTPSRFERTGNILYFTIPGTPPVIVYVSGDSNVSEETLQAFELGWRYRPSAHLSFDLTAFNNSYRHLVGTRPLPPQFVLTPTPALLVDNRIYNTRHAESRGAQASADWFVSSMFRVQAAGTWMKMHAPGVNVNGVLLEGTDPEQAYWLRVRTDLPRNVEVDISYRYVGSMPSNQVPAYDSVTARLGWRPLSNWEFSVTADNLFNNEHGEFPDEEEGRVLYAEIGRSIFAHVTWALSD